MLEYRVVVDRAGIKSIDEYYNLDRALEREQKLKLIHKSSKVFTQSREVTEWKNVK
jgi:hypothetical protein